MTDQELLDFLEAERTQPFVTCRDSTTGRGWRLHEITESEAKRCTAFKSVREALRYYMKQRGDHRFEGTAEFCVLCGKLKQHHGVTGSITDAPS